jgi:hypothetical protein
MNCPESYAELERAFRHEGLIWTMRTLAQLTEELSVSFPNDSDYQATVRRDAALLRNCALAVSKCLDGKVRA